MHVHMHNLYTYLSSVYFDKFGVGFEGPHLDSLILDLEQHP